MAVVSLNRDDLFRTDAYIDGVWTAADDGSRFTVDDPATGETIAEVARCGQAETARAIAAAEVALTDWRARPAKERAGLLRRWYALWP